MKKLLLVLLTLTVCGGLFAKEINRKEADVHQIGRAPQTINNDRSENNFTLVPNRDLSRYDYEVYTGRASGNTYGAIDLSNGSYTQIGFLNNNPFPMAEEYDGTSIYRVYDDLSLAVVNPDDCTTTALGTISGMAGTPTGLAYNWASSTMYIVILDGDYAPHLGTLDPTTLVATEIGVGTGRIIGIDFANDGYIYGPAIDDDSLYKIDPATGASTLIGPVGYSLNYCQDVTYDHATDQLYTITCGEAHLLGTYDLNTGALTMIADMNGQHSLIVSTLIVAEPDAPAAPSDVVVTPDAGGELVALIEWVCPDLTFGGDPLTDLDEMNIYRDDVLIYTDSAPIIGGAGSYNEFVTASGNYTYEIVGVNSVGEGMSVVVTTWLGEDVPDLVTDLLLVQTSPGVLSGTLTWVNPTTSLNGGAFNEAILGYHIVRNGNFDIEVIGEVTEYVDSSIPFSGNYYYTVQAYNSVGDGGIETSNTVLIADAGLLLMEDFDNGEIPEGWNIVGAGQPNWSISETNNADGTTPELEFNYSPSFEDVSRMVTQEFDTSGMSELALGFKHFLNDYNGFGYSIGFQSTSDGTTWNDIVVYNPTGDIGPEAVTETFINADVGSATFQLAVYFEGNSYNLSHWFIDDIMLCGVFDSGTIEGTVELEGGTGNVEDVEVEAGGITVNPAADGTYSIELQPGIYTVTASLADYEDGVVTDVVVTEGNATTGTDFTLTFVVDGDDIIIAATKLNGNYPNPFNPITNIAYSIKDAGNVTIEVYNLRGQLVKTLVNSVKETGNHTAFWNGTDNSNKSVSSGIYFYKLKSGNYTNTKKMLLLK